MEREIFYPNKLTHTELDKLSGWKLKIATLHFAPGREDCVRIGYGYEFKKKLFDECEYIYVVADRDEIYSDKAEISLKNEIDWDDPNEILSEIGYTIEDIYRKYLEDII